MKKLFTNMMRGGRERGAIGRVECAGAVGARPRGGGLGVGENVPPLRRGLELDSALAC